MMMGTNSLLWLVSFILAIFITLFIANFVTTTGADEFIDHSRRRLRKAYDPYIRYRKSYYFGAWIYPTYPIGPPLDKKSVVYDIARSPQVWCNRYQNEIRCWDWGCAWDYHLQACRHQSLDKDFNESPLWLSLETWLRVFGCLTALCIYIRLMFTCCVYICCFNDFLVQENPENVKYLYYDTEEESSSESEDHHDGDAVLFALDHHTTNRDLVQQN